jgi:hypothetical protein
MARSKQPVPPISDKLKKFLRTQQERESEELMADHGAGITDGLADVKEVKKGQYEVALDGMKFGIPKGVAEELLYKLTKALRPYAGYSIFDEIMMNLDVIIDRLMAGEPAEDGRDPGRAETFTMCLAIIRNPHNPLFEEERKRQMDRYKIRMSEDGDSETARVEHKRGQRPGRDGEMPEEPEEEEEVWTCGECSAEYETEEEAENCAEADQEEDEEDDDEEDED